MGYKDFYKPEIDGSLGLIYRLNILWSLVDTRALSGNFDKWELLLDRIYVNLLYRQELDIKKTDDGRITDINLSQQDREIHQKIKSKIMDAKLQVKEAIRTKDIRKINEARANHYNAILFYDIYLRKFEQKLGLYLKETESNPSKALFGR